MTLESESCPRAEALSALVDGELSAGEREQIAAHTIACPVCAAMLTRFVELRSAFSGIADADPGVDIAALVAPQLRPRQSARERRPRRRSSWQLAPLGAAAVGVLATGIYLGMLLTGGAAVVAADPSPMSVFDAIPPGGLCLGASCLP